MLCLAASLNVAIRIPPPHRRSPRCYCCSHFPVFPPSPGRLAPRQLNNSGGDQLSSSASRRCRVRTRASPSTTASGSKEVTLLDYGAGNVRSVRNAIAKLGFTVRDVKKPEDLLTAERLIFPGVGAYGSAMDILKERGLVEPLKEYIASGKPFFGVCLGLQLLYDGSEESGGVEGLGVIPGVVRRFTGEDLVVPHIGWNTLNLKRESGLLQHVPEGDRLYFVHSYRATPAGPL